VYVTAKRGADKRKRGRSNKKKKRRREQEHTVRFWRPMVRRGDRVRRRGGKKRKKKRKDHEYQRVVETILLINIQPHILREEEKPRKRKKGNGGTGSLLIFWTSRPDGESRGTDSKKGGGVTSLWLRCPPDLLPPELGIGKKKRRGRKTGEGEKGGGEGEEGSNIVRRS